MTFIQELWSKIAPRPPRPPEESHSRAGRNLKAAIPTAFTLMGLVALSIVVHIEFFVALVAIGLCIGLWEIAGAFLVKRVRIPLLLMWVANIAMIVATWFAGLQAGLVVFMIASFFIFLARIADGEKHSAEHSMAAIFALAWISFLGCFAVATGHFEHPFWAITPLIMMPVASDTGGWLFGILWGKHPLAPSVSPKKSWEGLLGSFVGTLLIAVPLWLFALEKSIWLTLLVALLAVAIATLGDLSESLLKRELGVKDMGSLFPGHGGMLDRIDSILMWAPVNYILLLL